LIITVLAFGNTFMKFNLKNSVMLGTVILTLAGIISRILGFYYRIYLTHQIGSEGIGLFQLVTPVLGIAFAVCSAGIQTAISRFSAASDSKGTWLGAGLVISIPVSCILGFLTYSYADFIAYRILLNEKCADLIRFLAFTFPFSTFHNCVNGSYFGRKRTGLPAFSQLAEQAVRILTVFLYSIYCQKNNIEVTAICAVYGNIAGEIASSLICAVSIFFDRQLIFNFSELPECSKKVFFFSLPLTANKLLMHLLESAESVLIPAQLILYGYSSSESLSIYGILMGMALPLILFPSAITNSMSVMLLPEVSYAQSEKNNSRITHTLNQSIQICMTMGIISTFLFLFYGARFGAIIFHEKKVEYFVKILATLCPFYYLTTTLGSILNGLGRTTLTCVHNISGILIRIAALIILVPIIGINGYMFGILISQLGVCIAHYICLNRMFHMGINAKENILLPTINSLISVGISMLVYIPMSIFSWANEPIRLCCGAGVCCVVFVLLTDITKAI
jgi:stage V sporulation protein B